MHRALVPLVLALVVLPLPAQEPAEAGAKKAEAAAVFAKGQAARQAGDWEEAIASFRKATEIDPDNGRAWHMLGYCLHGAQRLDEALEVHMKAAGFPEVAPVATYNVACVHSLRGEKDKAFEWLEKAVALGFASRNQLETDTDMDNIRDDPRFAKIAESLAGRVQAFMVATKRECSRLAYFGEDGSPGQIAIDYSPIAWKAGYEARIDDPQFVGRKWRLGGDFWTTLDNSVPLRMAGVEIPAGYWYLTLVHQGDRKFTLGVHDAAAVRKQRLDAFQAERLIGGLEVPLQHEQVDEVRENLQMQIRVPPQDNRRGRFTVRFGGHVLGADVEVGLVTGGQGQKQKQ